MKKKKKRLDTDIICEKKRQDIPFASVVVLGVFDMGWMAGVRRKEKERKKERQEHEQTAHTRIQILHLKRRDQSKRKRRKDRL